jgi:hypothetical protein
VLACEMEVPKRRADVAVAHQTFRWQISFNLSPAP